MELKRILARDSRSANEKAIQLYGKDVLIISSQRLDNQTELIVATDVTSTEPDAPDSAAPRAERATPPKTNTPFVPFSQLLDEAHARQGQDDADEAGAPSLQGPSPVLTAARLAREHESQRSLEIVEMLRMEVASLRKEFSLSRQMRPWQDGLNLSPAIQPLVQAMNDAGVPAALRALLTDSIQSLDSAQDAMAVMQQLLVTAMARAPVALVPSAAHALCGPSGAGKTSLVGRLAYAAAQKHGTERLAMVSFADHRPGAWAQMQLLAAQSGVSCFRATDVAMLVTLLDDLQGKTVWIDTCGADFGVQAELLRQHCPQVLRHAVLPVDATVTSVQKTLDNPSAVWTSLMLSKVDEAAHPWPLVKGLTENPLPVSWMVGDSQIGAPLMPFDAARLVQLALAPLSPLVPLAPLAPQAPLGPQAPLAPQALAPQAPEPTPTVSPKRAVKVKKPSPPDKVEVSAPRAPASAPAPVVAAAKPKAAVPVVKTKPPVSDDIVIPTLMGASLAARSRTPSKTKLSA